MFEYQKGRFVNAKKILSANIYRKKTGQVGPDGNELEEIRVAIDLESSDPKNACVYAGPFNNEEEARAIIARLPMN